MTSTTISTATHPTTAVRRRRALTVGGATLAATAPWLLAQAIGTDLQVTMAAQPPMVVGLPFVVGTALTASLAGWGALAVLQRVTSRARMWWTALAVTALLVSFLPVVSAQTSAAVRVLLALTHIAVAAVLIPGLRSTVPARTPADAGRSQS